MKSIRMVMAIDVEVPEEAWEEQDQGGDSAWVWVMDRLDVVVAHKIHQVTLLKAEDWYDVEPAKVLEDVVLEDF